MYLHIVYRPVIIHLQVKYFVNVYCNIRTLLLHLSDNYADTALNILYVLLALRHRYISHK